MNTLCYTNKTGSVFISGASTPNKKNPPKSKHQSKIEPVIITHKNLSVPNTENINIDGLIQELGIDLTKSNKKLGDFIAQKIGRETFSSLRLKAGLTQEQLAEKIGVKQSHIARWTNSKQSISLASLEKLSAALNVDMNTLVDALHKQWELLENDK